MNRLIYIVDDDPGQIALATAQLERAGFSTKAFPDPRQVLEAIDSDPPDAVITDFSMPQMSGLELVRALREHHPAMPVIMLTGMVGEELPGEALQAGASDFLLKPLGRGELVARIHRVLEEQPAQVVLLETEQKFFDGVVGSHPRVELVREFIAKVAATPRASALLLGESGTGKNLVARGIHRESHASRFRLVEINCAALPGHLIEAELFGYERGAFTDARETKKGLVEVADGGTLFLDEVGTLSPELQAKLLGFLESRTFRRLGSTKDRQVELRIIAATNADLAAEVRSGRFREDLFYRLNVAQVILPPLRDIRSDIPELARHFAVRAAEYFGKATPTLTPDSVARLLEHDWPGNARELRNVIERAMIFSAGAMLKIEPLSPTQVATLAPDPRFVVLPRGLTLAEVERRYIAETLKDTDGKVEDAAALLGVTRKVLWSRRRKGGFQPT